MSAPSFIIALTGGIASGKSTVSHAFATLGVPVFDADQVARELLTPPSPLIATIQAHFGNSVMISDGTIDRARLRTAVFEDPIARHWLEQQLHPPILAQLKEAATATNAPYCMVVIPLLCETGLGRDFIDRVLVVDVPEAVQKSRLMERDHLSETAALQILGAQASREARLAIADDVLLNTGDLVELQEKVRELHARYVAIAKRF